jgi:anti-sigma regulatory factor (Ser/Thr protein kinase)
VCESTARAELLLPLESTSPAAARRFAERSGCREHGLAGLDDALLLVSELVTNAVRYGGPPIVLAVDCDGAALHVRVRDGGASMPAPRRAAAGEESGRGMSLVDLLSSTWGVDPVPDEQGPGKEVWFELRR